MSYTFTTAVGDGVTTTFPFSFAGQDEGYLRASDITVYVAGVSSPFTINNTDPNKVVMTTAPAVGAEVLIRRIMPKNVPYADFARGNPFSQDTLNNTNLQMLYVIQELLDGFLPDGFYFKQNINMGGFKFTNLGFGTTDGDSVNYQQYVDLLNRLEAIENDLTGISSKTIPYYYIATGGETRWQVTGRTFDSAILFINGVFQNQNLGAFSISGNGFNFPEALQTGDEVYALIGSTPATGSMTNDQDVEVQQPFTGSVATNQHVFNSRYPSVEDAGAVGDSLVNDTVAFSTFESAFSGRDVDLHGKTFLVSAIPTGNRYFNGSFLVSGVTYKANNVLARDVNGIIILGNAAGSLPPDYVMSPNLFSYTSASVAIGEGTLANVTAMSQTTAIGAGAMGNTVQSFENTAIGEVALQNVNSDYPYYSSLSLKGTRNIGIGGNAGQFLVSGYNNVFVGRNCGTGLTASEQVTAVGSGALFGINVNGWFDYVENFAPNTNENTSIVAVGAYAGNLYQGINLTAVGLYAGRYLKTGQANTLIGVNAGRDLEINLGVYGFARTDLAGDTTLSTYVKTGNNVVVNCPGHGAVVNGYANVYWTSDGPAYAGHGHAWPQKVLAVSGDTFTVNCPYVGDGSGTCRVYWTTTATAGAGASSFTLIGNAAGQALRSGNNAIAIGASALISAQTANSCVVVGKDALRTTVNSSTTVAIGTQALQYNPIANSCVAVGHNAGQLLQSGAQPTGTLQNSTMIGANSRVSGDNQVQLGDSATTTYVYGTVQNRSDARDKILDNDSPTLGLDFITGLNPVQGVWNLRDDYVEVDESDDEVLVTFDEEGYQNQTKRRNRLHQWFIAQEVIELAKSLGLDVDKLGMIQHHEVNGGEDVYTIGYDEFIPPIVSAIKTLKSEIDSIKLRLDKLES